VAVEWNLEQAMDNLAIFPAPLRAVRPRGPCDGRDHKPGPPENDRSEAAPTGRSAPGVARDPVGMQMAMRYLQRHRAAALTLAQPAGDGPIAANDTSNVVRLR
jgi:hypothetical protein